jgi:metal-sulfur cluster biosynthetic enzyme
MADRETEGTKVTRAAVIEQLKTVNDPELMMNIVDLGLVYRVEVEDEKVEVDFTLTYPGCPASEHIRREIVTTLEDFTGRDDVQVKLVWEPQWRPDFMSEEARVSLGYPI